MGAPFSGGRPPIGNTSTLPANEAAVSKAFNIPVAVWGNQPSPTPTATPTSTAPSATVPLTPATTPAGVGTSASTMASAAAKKGGSATPTGPNVARPALEAGAPEDGTRTLLG